MRPRRDAASPGGTNRREFFIGPGGRNRDAGIHQQEPAFFLQSQRRDTFAPPFDQRRGSVEKERYIAADLLPDLGHHGPGPAGIEKGRERLDGSGRSTAAAADTGRNR